MAFNPHYYLYTTSSTFAVVKAMYKEYRIKQVKIHIMFKSVDTVPAA